MPTTYTHDLFGKRVCRKLPEKLQHLIRSNGNLYRIGQHGPDILFYYFISKTVKQDWIGFSLGFVLTLVYSHISLLYVVKNNVYITFVESLIPNKIQKK